MTLPLLIERPFIRAASILLFAISLLSLRAWERLQLPQVWQEDKLNILGFLEGGFPSLFEPVNGYLILVPKLVTMLSASISFSHYPLVSTVLAWLATIAVFYAIATAPTRLAGGVLLAAACMLVPSDPEVFGLPLYTFWWISLLLFLVVFWEEHSTRWGWRAAFIFLAALSSPVILVVLPLLWLRAWFLRKNSAEIGLGVWATLCTTVQLWVMWDSGSLDSGASHIGLAEITQVIPKFLGAYLIGNLQSGLQWASGLVLLLLLLVAMFRNRHSWVMWGLAYLWCVAVLMSMSRVSIDIIHPSLPEPRYFFFPFILMGWLLLQIAYADSNRWIRVGAWSTLAFAVLNALPVLDREHDDLNWEAHLNSCRQYDHYTIPVQSDGNAAHAWTLPMPGEICIELLASDPFFRSDVGQTFPYRVVGKTAEGVVAGPVLGLGAVVKNEWHGTDYYSVVAGASTLPGWRVLGSFFNSDNESGELVLHLRRGEQVWFRSEPRSQKQRIIIDGSNGHYMETLPATSEWALLEFSNATLPEEFNVRFVDGGGGWGEWSAVGFQSVQ